MESVQELHAEDRGQAAETGVQFQSAGYFLELSLDWIVLRASENIHHLLGKSHVTLIDELLGRFVHSQALHDLRNLFSRLSGTTGIGRAYSIRLTDEPELSDIAFQLSDGRILLEAVPSAGSFGEWFGTVGGLIAGLSHSGGAALLDAGARRMRALTGYDRVTLSWGERRTESSRGAFDGPADMAADLPALVADTQAATVGIFPRDADESSAESAVMRSVDRAALASLGATGTRSLLRIPFTAEGQQGEFRCESRTPREPCLELHAAAELFAQLFAMQLEIDQLKKR